MNSAPVSVSLLGWILTGGSALMLAALAFTYPHRHGPDAKEIIPAGMRWGPLFAWAAALLAVAPGILLGQEWGRLGAMTVAALYVVEALVARRRASSVISRVAAAALFAFILFSERADAFFGRSYF